MAKHFTFGSLIISGPSSLHHQGSAHPPVNAMLGSVYVTVTIMLVLKSIKLRSCKE